MERGKAAGRKIARPSDLFSLGTAWMSSVDVAA